jgi:RNA polymerase sigma-70 factor (ECF subfamily)
MSGPSPNEPADEARLIDLMAAYQNADFSAFEQLYAALVGDVRGYFARTHRDHGSVHDLVQETFLEMHRSRRTYTPPLPVRPWVFGIARHVAARGRRAAVLRPQEAALFDVDGDLPVTDPASGMPSAEAMDMEKAVAGLPDAVREPWLLHHVFGCSFESIAARLGITIMAAKLRSSRATKALRVALSATVRRA